MSAKPSVPGVSLENEIGYGASGSVWSAVDESGRKCAVKVFHPRNAVLTVDGKWESVAPIGESERREAFSEALKLAGIKHPNVVRIHAVHDLSKAQGIALVMDRVPWTLWEVVMRQGPLRGANVVSLVRDISQGLAALTTAGIAHGDIAADNIGITETGQVVLLDLASPFVDQNKTEAIHSDFQAVARCALFALTGSADPEAKTVLDQPVVQALCEVLTFAAQRRPQFSPEDFRLNQVQTLSLTELDKQLQAVVPPTPLELDYEALSTRWDAPLTKSRGSVSHISREKDGEWENEAQELYAVVRDMRREHEDGEGASPDTAQRKQEKAFRKHSKKNPAIKKVNSKLIGAGLCASAVLLAGGAYLVFSNNTPAHETTVQSEKTGGHNQFESTLPEWQNIVDNLSEKRRIALENRDPDDLMDVNAQGSRAEELDMQLIDHLKDEELALPPSTPQNLVKHVVFYEDDSAQLAVWTRDLPAREAEMNGKGQDLPEFMPVVMTLNKFGDDWKISEIKETGVATTK